MDDEIRALFEYAGDSIHCLYSRDKKLLQKIVDNLCKVEPFERPDMIVPIDEKILAIEHFEFDASSQSNKGSTDKRKLAERNREFDKLISDTCNSDELLISTTCSDCLYSPDYYIENFKRAFLNHLNKVEEYKTHLLNEQRIKTVDDIIVCFFIVDTTPLGCYYLEDGGMKSFIAFQVKECLDLISQAKEVNCFLFGQFDGKKNSLEFLSNCTEAVELIKEVRLIDFSVDEFSCFNPQETRFCVRTHE